MDTIYALIDPRDNAVRYVGLTESKNGVNRYREHLSDKKHKEKSQWISELRDAGLLPMFQILETVERSAGVTLTKYSSIVHAIEGKWIRRFDSALLFNKHRNKASLAENKIDFF